jgi:hypothetical protein
VRRQCPEWRATNRNIERFDSPSSVYFRLNRGRADSGGSNAIVAPASAHSAVVTATATMVNPEARRRTQP